MFWIRISCWLFGIAGLAMFTNWRGLRMRSDLPRAAAIAVHVDAKHPIAEVDEKFVSVAIDIANVVGGAFWDPSRAAGVMGTAPVPAYDFSRPRLRTMAAALAPAYLRVGGTDADRTVYEMSSRRPQRKAAKAKWVLKREQWDALNGFAQDVGYRIIFTLNVGASARGAEGRWDPESARGLIADAAARRYPVDVWELGNELNVFPLLHRHVLPASGYADDVQLARWLVDDEAPGTRLAGPAVAFWPIIGEGLPFAEDFMRAGGASIDILTWHYYPEQSFRCPVATNRAHAGDVLRPGELAEIDRWASHVEAMRVTHNPDAEVWLGETGGAQCGGEPELSDRFGSSLWWVDELGRMARRGQRVVVRQTLSGGDYGLIDDASMQPNPDYWASLLWRRIMGNRVLAAAAEPSSSVQTYAHCARQISGGVALALVNVHPRQATQVALPAFAAKGPAEVFLVEAEGPRAKTVRLNGVALELTPEGGVPELAPQVLTGSDLVLPPLSYAFVRFAAADVDACATSL